jgi:hypothetical protein
MQYDYLFIVCVCARACVSSSWIDTYTYTYTLRIYVYKHDAIDAYVSIIVIDIIVPKLWNGMKSNGNIILYYIIYCGNVRA